MDAAVIVFTLGAFAVWGYALWWAVWRSKYPWYNAWVLGLVTLFWFFGESLAIRLGKYAYPSFPSILSVNLPFLGGTPEHPRWLEGWLLSFVPAGEGPPWKLAPSDPMCKAVSYAIPLPVVAIEAALLFGFFRLAAAFLKVAPVGASFLRIDKGRWRTAIATSGLCALLMVNLFAVLDPVVSTTRWCQPGVPNPTTTYLPFGLWNWFTTQTNPGFWFGVPPVNYMGWFIGAAVFGFLFRLDDERDDLLIRKYKIVFWYVVATIAILAIFLAAAFGLVVMVEPFLIHGQEHLFGHPVFAAKTWQLGFVALLLGGALLACRLGRRQSPIKIEFVAAAPKVLALLYCFWLLLRFFHGGIFVVWCVTVVITTIVLGWQFIARRVFRDVEPPTAPVELQPSSGAEVV